VGLAVGQLLIVGPQPAPRRARAATRGQRPAGIGAAVGTWVTAPEGAGTTGVACMMCSATSATAGVGMGSRWFAKYMYRTFERRDAGKGNLMVLNWFARFFIFEYFSGAKRTKMRGAWPRMSSRTCAYGSTAKNIKCEA
jgi:hypothetical protein